MRIGIVLAVTPGYSETFFTSKIEGLQANGHNVVLLASKESEDFDLCKVYTAPKVYQNLLLLLPAMAIRLIALLPYLGRIKTFVRLEKKEGASMSSIVKKIYLNAHIFPRKLDWVHFGFATQAIDKECVAKAINAQMGVSFRGFDVNVYPLKNPDCYVKLWKYVDKVHSISNYLLEKAYGLGLSKEVPFQVITPAVVLQNLPTLNEQERASEDKTIQVLTIARISWIKGLDVAIKAMRVLKQKKIDFKYSIIGDGTPRELERYQFMVHEYGLKDKVIFCGKLAHQDTLEKLEEASVYVQSSLNEGFCNAVLEAQAMGKLVIASNAGALPENIINGNTGWLFPSGDAHALAEKIILVSNLSHEEKTKIAAAARQRVLQNFTIEQQQNDFVQFYSPRS